MHDETDANWVPAAVASDVLPGTVIPATLPIGPIAIWRSEAGSLYANGDRCPHRGMRLSHGFVRGETLSCIYHGWRYGADGACEHIPAHPNVTPPKTINCGPLAVADRNGVVYVASALPDGPPVDHEGFEALRSMVVEASSDAVLAAAGSSGSGSVALQLAGTPARLLVRDVGAGACLAIALLDAKASAADKLAASAALEALRRRAEASERGAA